MLCIITITARIKIIEFDLIGNKGCYKIYLTES